MVNLTTITTSIDTAKNSWGSFLIEPLETGQGITLGNALRRTLLYDLTGFAITGVRINNVKHEFSIIEGIREDILEILLNLKEIIFKPSIILNDCKNNTVKFKAFLKTKGPAIVTAGMFYLPKGVFKIINPEQYICTLLDDSDLYLEIDLEKNTGYQLIDENRKKEGKNMEKISILKPTTLLIDSIFMPVKKVNYKVKLIHDSYGNIKESLFIEIQTNGSITPKRSLQESIKILIDLFYPLLLTPQLQLLSTELFPQRNNFLINKTKIF